MPTRSRKHHPPPAINMTGRAQAPCLARYEVLDRCHRHTTTVNNLQLCIVEILLHAIQREHSKHQLSFFAPVDKSNGRAIVLDSEHGERAEIGYIAMNPSIKVPIVLRKLAQFVKQGIATRNSLC